MNPVEFACKTVFLLCRDLLGARWSAVVAALTEIVFGLLLSFKALLASTFSLQDDLAILQ